MEKKVKYIRVSTSEMNISRQEEDGFDEIFIDKISGIVPFEERPSGKQLLLKIQKGQINEVHVSALDRLGRDVLNILGIIEVFNKYKVNLFIQNLGLFSLVNGKTNSSFKLIVSVLANVAEMERLNIKERQAEGIAIAKIKGVYKGRKRGSVYSDSQILEKYKKVVSELEKGESLRRSALLGGVSLGTAQKVKRILNSRHT